MANDEQNLNGSNDKGFVQPYKSRSQSDATCFSAVKHFFMFITLLFGSSCQFKGISSLEAESISTVQRHC